MKQTQIEILNQNLKYSNFRLNSKNQLIRTLDDNYPKLDKWEVVREEIQRNKGRCHQYSKDEFLKDFKILRRKSKNKIISGEIHHTYDFIIEEK